MREVTTKGVGWAFGEASDLVVPPLNLVLYMHLRISLYTSNTRIASFENMELILASGTLKNSGMVLGNCSWKEGHDFSTSRYIHQENYWDMYVGIKKDIWQ